MGQLRDFLDSLGGAANDMDEGTDRVLIPPFQLVATLLYIGVLVSAYYVRAVEAECRTGNHVAGIITLTVLIAIGIGIEQYIPFRYQNFMPRTAALGFLLLRAGLIEAIHQLDCSGFADFLYLIIPFTAYFVLSRRATFLISIGYVALVWIKDQVLCDGCGDSEQIFDLLIFTIGMVFSLAMAEIVIRADRSRRQSEKLLVELAESHEQLKAYSDQVATLAAADERNRMARDIHDSLGHYLTVVNVQLEKALAYRPVNPDEADQAVRDAKSAAAEALRDVRQSVGTLRTAESDFDLRPALQQLVNQARHSNLAIDLKISGDAGHYSRPAQLALFRSVQEGLTNVHKHAKATKVSIQLALGTTEASLLVSDNGGGFVPDENAEPEGFGLAGLRERLALVGGKLAINSQPGQGSDLNIVIPAKRLAT